VAASRLKSIGGILSAVGVAALLAAGPALAHGGMRSFGGGGGGGRGHDQSRSGFSGFDGNYAGYGLDCPTLPTTYDRFGRPIGHPRGAC
jgi:hypothetical protein